jgi:hypothetical protein
LTFILMLLAQGCSAQSDLYLIALMGQSNMEGRGELCIGKAAIAGLNQTGVSQALTGARLQRSNVRVEDAQLPSELVTRRRLSF